MSLEIQILIALFLDLLFGGPRGFPNPSRMMRRFALALEPSLRRMIKSPREAGLVAAVMVVGFAGLVGWSLLRLAAAIHPWAYTALSIWYIYTALSVRTLADQSAEVCRALEVGNLVLARKRVSEMVRRDTDRMDGEEAARAAIESVARHSVDGVIAPLIYAFLFGPLAVILYKAVDVLDSTFGHRNEQYYDFGRFAAWLDRLLNWLPARIAVWFMAAGAMLLGMKPLAALRVSRRDGAAQANPNAGRPEAAMAGALGVQLGGPVFRSGSFDPLPFMGDPLQRLEAGHVRRANALLFAMTILAATIFALLHKGLAAIL
ncbi:MAG TPA: adenosylcobinamide-phosphate synthase CbiB [Syntrophales bacterium]|nr:adenosylcobinamide-phosphate synthase CbiB [Syntrophales bacterium]